MYIQCAHDYLLNTYDLECRTIEIREIVTIFHAFMEQRSPTVNPTNIW